MLILCFNAINANGQFNIVGTATSSGSGCFTLTTTTWEAGSFWSTYEINLNDSFDVTLTLNFGNISSETDSICGADGMTFILQPISNGVGAFGGGIGFQGITPSLGVIMDDFQNTNNGDPLYDHMSMSMNGDINHGSANELIPYTTTNSAGFPTEIKTGLDYTFRFKWDSTTHTIQVWFNGALMFTYTGVLEAAQVCVIIFKRFV